MGHEKNNVQIFDWVVVGGGGDKKKKCWGGGGGGGLFRYNWLEDV